MLAAESSHWELTHVLTMSHPEPDHPIQNMQELLVLSNHVRSKNLDPKLHGKKLSRRLSRVGTEVMVVDGCVCVLYHAIAM